MLVYFEHFGLVTTHGIFYCKVAPSGNGTPATSPLPTRRTQMLVFDRKEPIQKFLDTCRGKLHIKKKARGAALLDGEEVCSFVQYFLSIYRIRGNRALEYVLYSGAWSCSRLV